MILKNLLTGLLPPFSLPNSYQGCSKKKNGSGVCRGKALTCYVTLGRSQPFSGPPFRLLFEAVTSPRQLSRLLGASRE